VTGLDDPRFFLLPVAARLEVERVHRPAAAIRVDTVFETATRKLGIALRARRQMPAYPLMAAYCEQAETAAPVSILACEYADADAARRGRDLAMKAVIPRREIILAKSTSISVTPQSDSVGSTDQAKKLVDAMQALGQ
jgi:hypothetical protein